MAKRFAWIRKNDSARIDAEIQDLADLSLGGTVEGRAERGENFADHLNVIAFHG